MSDIAIRVENIGWVAYRWAAFRCAPRDKRYPLGGQKSAVSTGATFVVDSFRESFARLLRKPDAVASVPAGDRSGFRTPDSDFWALQDINFLISQYEL